MSSLSTFPKMGTKDDSVYQVYLMCFARIDRKVRENFIITDFHDGPMGLDYNLFIVRNESRTILVDTGFSPRAAKQRGRTLMFDPIEGLKKIGIDPDEIEDILITHLHYDHAGNMDRFGKARFHLQDKEAAYATGRCMCNKFARLPFDVEDIVTLVRRIYADRVCFHDGDAEFLPGISLFALPGHSVSVQAVRVMTERGPVLLASDASHYFANVLNAAPFVLTMDLPKTLDSYERMMKLSGGADRLVPGHDPKLRRLYPSVTVNGIELFALHEQPRPFDRKELERVDDFDATVF